MFIAWLLNLLCQINWPPLSIEYRFPSDLLVLRPSLAGLGPLHSVSDHCDPEIFAPDFSSRGIGHPFSPFACSMRVLLLSERWAGVYPGSGGFVPTFKGIHGQAAIV